MSEAQRGRLAALEPAHDEGTGVEGKAVKRRGGKAKPVRHQLRRTPTPTQQARWEAVQQAREQGFSLRAIARTLGHGSRHRGEIPKSRKSAHQETQRQGRGPDRIINHRRLTQGTYSLFN